MKKLSKKAEKQRISYVDTWITQKAVDRQLNQIVENQIVGRTKLNKFDIIRNIQKYDPQSINGQQQNNTFQSLLQKLEKAYKKYMKTQFSVVVYDSVKKIPNKIYEYLNDNMFKICRKKYVLTFLPAGKGQYVFVSQAGTKRNPIIGGVAVVEPYIAGGSGNLIGLDDNTYGVEVRVLCSHMGQGAAILDEIRRWMVKFDKKMTVLELGPRNEAIPFYIKYGFTYNSNYGRMIMNVKKNDIRKKKTTQQKTTQQKRDPSVRIRESQ